MKRRVLSIAHAPSLRSRKAFTSLGAIQRGCARCGAASRRQYTLCSIGRLRRRAAALGLVDGTYFPVADGRRYRKICGRAKWSSSLRRLDAGARQGARAHGGGLTSRASTRFRRCTGAAACTARRRDAHARWSRTRRPWSHNWSLPSLPVRSICVSTAALDDQSFVLAAPKCCSTDRARRHVRSTTPRVPRARGRQRGGALAGFRFTLHSGAKERWSGTAALRPSPVAGLECVNRRYASSMRCLSHLCSCSPPARRARARVFRRRLLVVYKSERTLPVYDDGRRSHLSWHPFWARPRPNASKATSGRRGLLTIDARTPARPYHLSLAHLLSHAPDRAWARRGGRSPAAISSIHCQPTGSPPPHAGDWPTLACLPTPIAECGGRYRTGRRWIRRSNLGVPPDK